MPPKACAILALIACVGACSDDEGGGGFCEPGVTRVCGCANGAVSMRTCLDDGSDFGECDCDFTASGGSGGSGGTGGAGGSPSGTGGNPGSRTDGGPMGPPPGLVCGDGQCMQAEGETCARCPRDCGECESVACACGDGVCERERCGEACGDCVDDCGTCAVCDDDAGSCGNCGDGSCDAAESPASCEQDCGTDPGDNAHSCGNGVCEPGEDASCSDCDAVEQTCDAPCTGHDDCAQPWTGCIGGDSKCIPLVCKGCFDSMQYCCWCDNNTCSGASCAPSRNECPPCS